LVGASYAGTDLPSARDRLRLGIEDPPGEAAIFVLLGEGGRPLPARDRAWERRWMDACGDCGAVNGLAGFLREG
jgi:hypothetical protein